MKNRICVVLMIVFMSMIICPKSVFAFPQYTYLNNVDMIKSTYSMKDAHIAYQYRVFDGVLYKRLYDFTNGKPLGNWERV